MLRQYRIRHYNFKLLVLVTILAVIGIIAVGSAEPSLQSRQIAGFACGFFLMLILSLFDYSVILKLYWVLYLLNLVLLVLVIAMGEEGNGAQRWLKFRGFPSFSLPSWQRSY